MGATYDLGLIKSLVAQNRYLITKSAMQTALEIGFDDVDIIECIVEELAESHFLHDNASNNGQGRWPLAGCLPNLLQESARVPEASDQRTDQGCYYLVQGGYQPSLNFRGSGTL